MKNRFYTGEFQSWQDVVGGFGGDCPKDEPRYVFADYDQPSYEGYSTVITSSDGRKFRVAGGSHCSCFGLEGQWEPTDHTITDLRKMMEATYGFFNSHRDDIVAWLKHIKQ